MVFSSMTFLFLFLPAVLLLYYNPWIKGRKYRNILLLIASLYFYAWGEPIFVWLMVLSIIVGWFVGLKIGGVKSKTGRKRWLTLGVTFHLSLLFVFKYLSFLAAQLGMLVHKDFSSISLVPSVGEVVKVDLRHFTGSVQRLIEQEKPDLVFVMYTPWYKKDIDWQSHKDEFDFR